MKPRPTKTVQCLTLILFLFQSVAMVSCSSKPIEEAIIGTWVDESNGEFISFAPDKTFHMGNSQQSMNGQWTKVGAHQIRADVSSFLGSQPFLFDSVHVSGSKLTLRNNGITATYLKQ